MDLTPFFQALLVGEKRGITTLGRLAVCPLLTPEERDHAGDVIRVDEIRHATLVKGLIPTAEELPIGDLNLTDTEVIARQPRTEGLLVRRGPLLYPYMTSEQVGVMQSIIEDEKGHIRWSLTVRDRLKIRSVRALHLSPAAWMAARSLNLPSKRGPFLMGRSPQ